MKRMILSILLMTNFTARAADAPTFHWLFEPGRVKGKEVQALAGGKPAKFSGSARIQADDGPAHLSLNGSGHRVWVSDELSGLKLPEKEITISAWVKVDKPVRWGGICGVIQDNGEYERGWLLGYENARFNFALNTVNNSKLTYLTDKTDYKHKIWHYVTGVYDGTEMRLYVNGRLRVSSAAQQGAIRYPPQAFFEIGAYHDNDEFYRLAGGIHEVAVWPRALTVGEIQKLYDGKKEEFPLPPETLKIVSGPFVNWIDRTTVRLEWETADPMAARVKFGPIGDRAFEVRADDAAKRHTVTIPNVLPGVENEYVIRAQGVDRKEYMSNPYVFDSSFYFDLPTRQNKPAPFEIDAAVRKAADRILQEISSNRGYCLVLGAVDGSLVHEIARRTEMQVMVVEPDADRVQAIRKVMNQTGLYGVRVSVHQGGFDDLSFGPYIANLITSERLLIEGTLPGADASELWRVLRPAGGVAVLGGEVKQVELMNWFVRGKVPGVKLEDGKKSWAIVRRGKLKGAGDWTHQYAGPDNTTNSRDDLVRGDMGILWWGEPGPKPMPDRGGRNPAPLAANGRLFMQGNRMFFGMDAYNGTILWSLSAPEIRRSNLPRDGSNMVASDDFLYLSDGRHCIGIDGQTGERKLRFSAPKGRDWSFMAVAGKQLLGSSVLPDSAYKADDKIGEWYDSGKATEIARVVSDSLFSFDRHTGKQEWNYKGAVMNSTITVADGVVYFVESRNPDKKHSLSSRVEPADLNNQYLVALDQLNGRKLWERPVDFSKCVNMLYLVHSKGTLVVTGSEDITTTINDRKKTATKKYYRIYAYDVSSPALRFGTEKPEVPKLWENIQIKEKYEEAVIKKDRSNVEKLLIENIDDNSHHGGHLQHPLVVGEKFYTDNRVFALREGKLLPKELKPRRGCGNMAASNYSMFYRAHSHGYWDMEAKEEKLFKGIRSGCWLGLIPAQGLMLAPESSGGCSCSSGHISIQTSAAWVPRSALKKPKK